MKKKIQSFYLLSLLLLTVSLYIAMAASNRVIATIVVGDSPSGIALTPDNSIAYVANSNSDALPGGDTVSVLNLRSNTVITTISDASFNEPYRITLNKAGTIAYVANSNSTTVSLIDTATNQVVDVITGFDGPSGIVITPAGDVAYVNNYGSPGGVGSGNGTTVRVVNLTTNTIVGPPITVGLAPASLAITPDGAFVYVINYVDGNPGTGTVSIIQTSTNTVVGTIPGLSGPFSIAITPNGKYAYVTNFGSNNFSPVGTTVSVIDLRSNTISATIQVGTQPSGVAISANGCFAYVTNYNTLYLGPDFTDLTAGQGTVNIIDVATNTVICPVLVAGASPSQIALSSDGKFAYVTNYSVGTVTVIDLRDSMWLNICA